MNICVFSSSSNGINPIYFEEANKLGQLIGKNGHNLINGGANVGLMEEVASVAQNSGANTIGIIPQNFIDRSLASKYANKIIVTENMQQRKARMRELADAFVALPGGFGTLDEMLEVITLRQLSYHNKPVVFINTNNFYKYLIKQFEISFSEHFAKEIYRDLYFFARGATEAVHYIENYKSQEPDSKWFVVPEKKS